MVSKPSSKISKIMTWQKALNEQLPGNEFQSLTINSVPHCKFMVSWKQITLPDEIRACATAEFVLSTMSFELMGSKSYLILTLV
jgi:hypothetical protein